MKSRHKAREVALQLLYQYDLSTQQKSDAAKPDSSPRTEDAAQLIRELRSHFEHFKVPNELQEFAATLVAGTLREIKSLDEILEKSATHWKVSRMSTIDRSLLRMALFEMLYCQETPAAVVIDEAIELAKEFGTSETPAFINGILDHARLNTSKLS